MNVSDRVDRIEARLTKLESAFDLSMAAESTRELTAFPEPLAGVLSRYRSALTHSVRFLSLIDSGEITIKYSWAFAAALDKKTDPSQLFTTPPTLGLFASSIKRALISDGIASEDEPFFRSLVRSFQKDNGKDTPAARYLLDEFVNLRNRERGHGSALPDGAYEDLARSTEPPLKDAIRSCDHLRFPLVRVEKIDVGNPDWFAYTVTLLTGLTPMPGPIPILSKDRIKVGSACFWDGSTRLFLLSPFVEFRVCSVCGLEHTFFLEKVTERGLHYHSYAANHRMIKTGTLERK